MQEMLTGFIEAYLRDMGDDVNLEADDDLASIGFDSIGYVRLIDHIDRALAIKVPDADVTLEQFGTVSRIAAYLEQRGAVAPDAVR
jgi:acyl carrier protein